MIILNTIKKSYIYLILILRKSGIINFLDKFEIFKKSHLRSLFFIYDLKYLIKNKYLWVNYKSQRRLKKILKTKFSILEYGSGASTIWFSQKVKSIISIEHDYNWFKSIKKIINSSNVKLKLVKPDKTFNLNFKSEKLKNKSFKNYVKFPLKKNKKFDLIFIDGRCRDQCIYFSYRYLVKKKGIIVLDNSSRERYSNSKKWLMKKAKRVEMIYDYVPTLPYKEETTFFFFNRS